MSNLLLCADWVLPIMAPPIKDGCVAIKDHEIAYVGRTSDYHGSFSGIREYPQGIILPGLINAHVHLNYSLLSGRVLLRDGPFPALNHISQLKRSLNTNDFLRSVYVGASECISAGMTTVANNIDPSHPTTAYVTTRMGLRTVAFLSVRNKHQIKTIDEALQGIAIRHKHTHQFRLGIGPHSLYLVGPDRLREWAHYVEQQGLFLSIHLAELADEDNFFRRDDRSTWVGEKLSGFYQRNRSDFGSAILAAAGSDLLSPRTVVVHCTHVDEVDIQVLRAKGCSVCLCPKSNVEMGNAFPPLHLLAAQNINICLGTDSSATCRTYDLFDDMRLLFFGSREITAVAQGLSTFDVLCYATINGARALGLETLTGSLEIGKRADLIVVRAGSDRENPYDAVVLNCRACDVEMTVVDGKVLWDRNAPQRGFLNAGRVGSPVLQKLNAVVSRESINS